MIMGRSQKNDYSQKRRNHPKASNNFKYALYNNNSFMDQHYKLVFQSLARMNTQDEKWVEK